jgi:hypothetical protein
MKTNYMKALNHLRKAGAVDVDLSYYLKLSKEDLDALREHYGEDQVARYQVEMEQRRGGRNGAEK